MRMVRPLREEITTENGKVPILIDVDVIVQHVQLR
jgi:hypothetical protein